MRFHSRVLAGCLVAATMAGDLAAARAADFRVENQVVFPGEPPVKSTTLFAGGKAYDFLDGEQETIVFDKAKGSIVILDLAKRIKTEISIGDVSTQIGRLRQAALNSPREFVRMSASPQFREEFDAKTGRLTLDNKWIRYVAETAAPQDPAAAAQYVEFADWVAQVNAMLNPPNLPFARMKLNKAIKERQEFPNQVELTLRGEERKEPLVVRSQHRFQLGLARGDEQRIEAVEKQLAAFRQVSFDAFRR